LNLKLPDDAAYRDIELLLEAPEELFVMWSIPFHVPLQVDLCPSLLVEVAS
jgi:hypothetical protein